MKWFLETGKDFFNRRNRRQRRRNNTAVLMMVIVNLSLYLMLFPGVVSESQVISSGNANLWKSAYEEDGKTEASVWKTVEKDSSYNKNSAVDRTCNAYVNVSANANMKTGVSADADANANTNAGVSADANANANTNAGVTVDADANVNADMNANVNANTGVNADTNANTAVVGSETEGGYDSNQEIQQEKSPNAGEQVKVEDKKSMWPGLRVLLIFASIFIVWAFLDIFVTELLQKGNKKTDDTNNL